jgi:hypothetical protein
MSWDKQEKQTDRFYNRLANIKTDLEQIVTAIKNKDKLAEEEIKARLKPQIDSIYDVCICPECRSKIDAK